MNRKYLPALFMLTAAAVMCIITYIMDFSIISKLLSLLVVIIIFGLLGYVLKYALDSFYEQNRLKEEEKESEELAEADGKVTEEQDGIVTGQNISQM